MIITCQNCQTHYSVDLGLVGGGKTVRCENCGNSWHQRPQQAAPPPMAPPPPVYAAPVAQQAPQAPLQQPFEAAPAPEPEPAPEPVPEPAPAPEPEPIPQPEATPEADADAEMAAMEEAAEEPAVDAGGEEVGDTSEAAEADNDALSPDQLNEMFGEDAEGEGFDSLSGADGGGDEDGITDLADLENIPDPEPIPQVFSAGDDDLEDNGLEKKTGKGKIIGIAVLVLILALGGGGFFGRSMIIELWPPAADIYAMLSLGGAELGDGLVIEDVKSSRQVEGGVDVLVIRGVIANASEEEQMVPMIRVSLFDANGDEVQHAIAAPLKNRLQAGTKIGFSAKLPEPSALGRRVVVTFSETEK